MVLKGFNICLLLFLMFAEVVSGNIINDEKNYAGLVNSTLGTKGKGFGVEQQYLEAGYTFPGATLPFGMVQFTTTFFDENKGFVVNQMSGAGCHNMGNLPMLPISGELTASPNNMMGFKPETKIKTAYAGYYQSTLFNQINCELTATTRTGMARLNFSVSEKGTVLIGTGINSTEVKVASVKITGPNTFEGTSDGGNFCGANSNYKIYFAGEFSRPAKTTGTWEKESLFPDQKTAAGNNSGAYFTFETTDNSPVGYKIAISYVSVENAKLNLATENEGWDFDRIKIQAEKEWNNVLKTIDVKGGTDDKTIQFYSHLYHAFINPSIFNDVNGQYIGADFQVHTVENGDYFTAFSNWDTYRTQIQLLSMLAPERASQIVASMIAFAEQSGGGFPRWVCANFETGIMQGDPTTVLVANAYAFGAKNFDLKKAMTIMRRGAEIPETKSQGVETRQHLAQYLNNGFISESMGSSMLLEYTSADFAIGQFARQAFQDNELYRIYLKRSQKWKNLYNPKTTWLQSRFTDGSWKPQGDDWREASYKNYFWMVPYDLKSLTDTIGGAEVAEKRLDEFFTKLNANYHEEFFAAGNEPSFQSPWTYNWIGKPEKTQQIVRRILNEQYSNRNCGLPGNDDMGAMAAWYVFADMGIYPMIPGVAGFSLNSPAFPEIKITLGNNKKLVLSGGSETNIYVAGLKVNGKNWNSTWLPFSKIKDGGTLQYKLGAKPSKWGANERPPSFDKF